MDKSRLMSTQCLNEPLARFGAAFKWSPSRTSCLRTSSPSSIVIGLVSVPIAWRNMPWPDFGTTFKVILPRSMVAVPPETSIECLSTQPRTPLCVCVRVCVCVCVCVLFLYLPVHGVCPSRMRPGTLCHATSVFFCTFWFRRRVQMLILSMETSSAYLNADDDG